jgi:hypothetical protein
MTICCFPGWELIVWRTVSLTGNRDGNGDLVASSERGGVYVTNGIFVAVGLCVAFEFACLVCDRDGDCVGNRKLNEKAVASGECGGAFVEVRLCDAVSLARMVCDRKDEQLRNGKGDLVRVAEGAMTVTARANGKEIVWFHCSY